MISFDSFAERAIGSDGVPIPESSYIRVEGSGSKRGAFGKPFEPQTPVSLSFPVGDELHFRVSVVTASALWSSQTEKLTVQSGTNSITVKLSKKASALNNLLFSIRSEESYVLRFKVGGTQIFQGILSVFYAVCRDNKGRIYLAYKGPDNAFAFERYNSEGDADAAFKPDFSPAVSALLPRKFSFASDWVRGTSYIALDEKPMPQTETIDLKRLKPGLIPR